MAKDDAEKIALFCNVEPRAVIEERDKEFSIYEVPLSLVENKLDELIVEKLSLQAKPLDIADWREMLQRITQPGPRGDDRRRRQVHQAPRRLQVGLRVARPRRHRPPSRASSSARSRPRRSSAKGPSASSAASTASWCPAASATAASQGKIEAIRYARERKVPFFGICLGLQCAVDRVRPQRPRPGGRQQHRVRPQHAAPGHLPARRAVRDHRQGRHDAAGRVPLRAAPRAAWPTQAYGSELVHERHRHRYEFNNEYRQQFAANGLVVTGTSPDGKLVEVIELPDHPWFLAVQCHPEFKSKPTQGPPAVPRLHPGEPAAARAEEGGAPGSHSYPRAGTGEVGRRTSPQRKARAAWTAALASRCGLVDARPRAPSPRIPGSGPANNR